MVSPVPAVTRVTSSVSSNERQTSPSSDRIYQFPRPCDGVRPARWPPAPGYSGRRCRLAAHPSGGSPTRRVRWRRPRCRIVRQPARGRQVAPRHAIRCGSSAICRSVATPAPARSLRARTRVPAAGTVWTRPSAASTEIPGVKVGVKTGVNGRPGTQNRRLRSAGFVVDEVPV